MLNAGRSFKIKVFCLQTGNTRAWVKCPFQLLCHGNQRICLFFPPRLLSNDIKFRRLKFFSYILSSLSPISSQYTLLSLFLCSTFFLPFNSLLPPFYVSMRSLVTITLKALHVHHILSLCFPLLFAHLVHFDVASLCHGLQHTFFLYFAKSTELLDSVELPGIRLWIIDSSIVAGSASFNPFAGRQNQKKMPQTWTGTISEICSLLQLEDFCGAEHGSQQYLPSPHTIFTMVGSIATGQWLPSVSIFLSLPLTFFPLLNDYFLTKGSNFLDSEDSRQKING